MRIVVVGAGIAGLAAAHFATKAIDGAEVLVLEGSPRIGGKLALGQVGGHTVDLGAESILARRPEGTALIEAIGVRDDLVHPASVPAALWTRGQIRPLPPTVQGIPSDLDALAASGIITGPVESCSLPVPDQDVAVADFVRERVGDEVLDRLVEPLLGGVYAGRAADLSLNAAAPALASLGDDLLAGAAAARASTADHGPVFAGLVGGVGRLPGLVAEGIEVRTSAPVRAIRRERDQWIVSTGPVGDVVEEHADAVVVAAPAAPAARLLASVAPEAAFDLGGIDYASMAIVTAALPADGFVEPLASSGFLVPPIDTTYIKAATYSSVKWPWLAEQIGPETVIVRCSVGRGGESALLRARDADVAALALADVRQATGFEGEPIDVHVQRWGGALPQYEVGHLERVAAIEHAIADVPALELCGAAYKGVGIPAVIASAEQAVARLNRAPGTMDA